MFERYQLRTLLRRLEEFPAVALLDPRRSGKTTLAIHIAAQGLSELEAHYLDLEANADRAKLADPALYLAIHEDKLVILDQIQRMPGLFQELRGLIDRGRRQGHPSGRFPVLGSASIDLLRQSGETLAGRIAPVALGPLKALEVDESSEDSLWTRGG